jgi:hypothetical protein
MNNNACKFCGIDVALFRWCENSRCKLYGQRLPKTEGFGSALCKACGELLSFTNPCPECLRNEPATILRRLDQSDRDALKTELGYSGEVEWRVFNEDAGLVVGKEWEGYNLELLGIVLGRHSEWTIPQEGVEFYERVGAIVRTPEGYDIVNPALLLPFTCIPDSTDPDLIITLCRIRAHYKDSPLYSEMRPHNYGVRRVSICGLEHKHTQKDREKAYKGLDLLRAAAKKLGRRKDSRTYSKTEFLRAAPLAYRRFFDRTGEHPTGSLLAVEMYLSRSAFFDHLRDYELTIEDIRAQAMQL